MTRTRGRFVARPRREQGASARPASRSLVGRPHVLALLFTLFLGGFTARIYDLQIKRYSSFATQSADNFQRDEIVRALRGEIRTRDGVLIVTNRLAVDLVYKGGDIADWERLRFLSGYDNADLPKVEPGGEVTLVRNVAEDKLAALYEFTVGLGNVELRERVERFYPQGSLAAHLLGYTREANESEVKESGYALGDLVGATGLEASLQDILKGRNGVRRVEVTAAGQAQGERVVDPGQKGKDVVLTIDSRLQAAAERALREGLKQINETRARHGDPPDTSVNGAIVALDPRTNEVLALASSPTYDPNWFSQSPRPPQLADALLGRNGYSTMNRAVQMYDSGSVFKPTSTLAYIERWGNKSFSCTPFIRYGSIRRNWSFRFMGMMDGRAAIANSCNTWYYQAAIDANPVIFSNYLAQRAKELGFGRETGLEIIGEKTGYLPSQRNEEKRWADVRPAGERYFPGQALSFAIGQDALRVTPAQIAYVLSAIVDEGRQRPLTVLKAVGGEPRPRKAERRVPGDVKNFKLVKQGMEWTTTRGSGQSGTAAHILGPDKFPVPTAGKTGTAENALSKKFNLGYTNAWYEGYGPVDNPNFLVVAFFENGGEGSGTALPAVAKMFAARWCLKVDENGKLDPPMYQQTPCLGELDARGPASDGAHASTAQPTAPKKTP
ncbi:penicillin-binding transpeptidase domain-containing protein [Deinococcus yavapaiensis]|uniref:beta-lactamase n=1 Tax=Deinococcus yavapaiensis KR-236 TaxID=694435 RepID=A0A318S204_9DEIO|nr:penicillin-binding transpeptidase domain-containing protein [Deinococcus yavapaiensis]PYE48967.1 penicillin-binding protein 2 [Deinococcus yavapaiensis KR-236]